MRKLGRILRRVITAISLLLFMAVLVAWVRGYWAGDELRHREYSRFRKEYWRAWHFSSRMGGMSIIVEKMDLPPLDPSDTTKLGGPRPFEEKSTKWLPASFDVYEHIEAHKKVAGGTRRSFQVGRVAFYRFQNPQADIIIVALPCWILAVACGVLPICRFIVWRSGRRLRWAREGRCRGCGYDLRASPDRCPECGLAVEEKREARSDEREDGEHRTLNIEHPTSK